jgi:uncharacterized membrane protein YjgN (DUF898 family)
MASLLASSNGHTDPSALTAGPVRHTLGYVGRTRTLFAIFFKNLGLTIITLGIYRFWAKTRTRRFLWSSTTIEGEPFEYIGTGKELFIGFLKAVAILVPLFAAVQIAQLWLGKDQTALALILQYVQTLAIIALIYAGSYAARRYRMSRTLWSGIRFHQAGSAWRYVGHALLGLFFCIITLGFYFPYFQTRMLRYEMENLRFGTARFRFTGRGGELLRRFVVCWISGVVMYFLLVAAVIGIVYAAMQSGAFTVTRDEEGNFDAAMIPYLVAGGVFFYLAMGVTFLIAGTWYQSKFWRFRAAHTQCEGLRFAMPNVSTGRLMRLLVGNWVLGIFSLGLLVPLVMQRSMRFWCRHLEISGTIDLQRIAQAEGGPRTGEGLAGFFDIDVG